MDVRALRRIFRSPERPRSIVEPLRTVMAGALRLESILRVLYVFPIFWLVTHLHELRPLLAPRGVDLRWPVAWMAWVGPDVAAPLVIGASFVVATVAAWIPERRVARIAVFITLLQVLALKFSFGKIHHLMHGWLFTTFVLAFFLPNEAFDARRATRRQRQASLLAFSGAQVALALTYSLAGFGKLLAAPYQWSQGQVTSLHPSSLARHVADRILQTHADSVLGDFMIEHGVFIWPMMLATLYLQLFALWAVFRPRLHRLWAVGLIGFHVMTKLSMTIDFTPNVLLLGVLWLASPTAPARMDIRGILVDLPVVGGVFRRLGGGGRPGSRQRRPDPTGDHKARNADQQEPGRQSEQAAEA